jgi:hypothetical protein
MTAAPVTTTADLFYAIEPEGGVRAYQRADNDPLTGERTSNVKIEAKSVVIENVRGKEDSVSLDTAGFQFYKHTSKHTTFDNDEEIYRVYYPESIELIKKLTGASRVELFDHSKQFTLMHALRGLIMDCALAIRRRRPGEKDSLGRRQPVAQVHVDQTVASSIARVHRHLPAPDVPKLLERRFQIINLWRPIAVPAIDWPLALCDYRSIDLNKDTFPVTRISVESTGETMGVKYNENHKWKYLHGMTPEEIVLIKWQVASFCSNLLVFWFEF